VVSQDGDDRQARRRQEIGSGLGLEHTAVFGQIPGNQQEIRELVEVAQPRELPFIFGPTDVQVSNCRNPNPNMLVGAAF
jgi:hypothetical protein